MLKAKYSGLGSLSSFLPLIALVGVVLIISKPLRDAFTNLFAKFGLTTSKATTGLDEQSAVSPEQNPWSPDFYKHLGGGARLLRAGFADQLCTTIWEALNGQWAAFDDDEDAVFAAFKGHIFSQSQMSFLCERWLMKYPAAGSLLDWMRGGLPPDDRLSDADVYLLVQYVANLPVK